MPKKGLNPVRICPQLNDPSKPILTPSKGLNMTKIDDPTGMPRETWGPLLDLLSAIGTAFAIALAVWITLELTGVLRSWFELPLVD